MPNLIKLGQGAYADYAALGVKDNYTVYFTNDTKQIFLGTKEMTKTTHILDAEPTSTTVGDLGSLYAYNGNLYLCADYSAADGYTYVRVANVNDMAGSVTSVDAGEGLETESGSAITSTGSIKHSVPTGATTVTDPTADAAPAFGSTFAIQGVSTDKFGHVVASNTRTITIPNETVVAVSSTAGAAETLAPASTFQVVTGVAKGDGSHDIVETLTTFTLPTESDTTYDISSTTEGVITLTPSVGNATTVLIDGWNDLAKKSELSAVFIFKGTVATVSALPQEAEVGWVYHVTTTSSGTSAEYVCVEAGTGSSSPATWEELGIDLDLSAYALSADVIQRVTGADGEVPLFNADGTLSSTGFTLGCSVPSTAVFTDTTYEPVQAVAGSDPGLMTAADKIKLDGIEAGGEVNVLEGVQVDGTDLTIDANKKVNVTLGAFGITATAAEINDIGDKLDKTDGGVVAGATTFTLPIEGSVTGSASTATCDAAGNVIDTTYATKTELSTALTWIEF